MAAVHTPSRVCASSAGRCSSAWCAWPACGAVCAGPHAAAIIADNTKHMAGNAFGHLTLCMPATSLTLPISPLRYHPCGVDAAAVQTGVWGPDPVLHIMRPCRRPHVALVALPGHGAGRAPSSGHSSRAWWAMLTCRQPSLPSQMPFLAQKSAPPCSGSTSPPARWCRRSASQCSQGCRAMWSPGRKQQVPFMHPTVFCAMHGRLWWRLGVREAAVTRLGGLRPYAL